MTREEGQERKGKPPFHTAYDVKGKQELARSKRRWVVQAEEMVREEEQCREGMSMPGPLLIPPPLSKCLPGATLLKAVDLDFKEFLSASVSLSTEWVNASVYLTG